MIQIIYILLIIKCLLINLSYQQESAPASPCPNLFQYGRDSEWYGMVQVPSPKFGQTIKLKVMLSLGAPLPSSYVGTLELAGSRNVAIQNIMNGQNIQYRIRFPIQSPIPKLTQILYNDRVLCSGPPDNALVVTGISLDHTLYNDISGGGNGGATDDGYEQQSFGNNDNSNSYFSSNGGLNYNREPDILPITNNYNYNNNNNDYDFNYQNQQLSNHQIHQPNVNHLNDNFRVTERPLEIQTVQQPLYQPLQQRPAVQTVQQPSYQPLQQRPAVQTVQQPSYQPVQQRPTINQRPTFQPEQQQPTVQNVQQWQQSPQSQLLQDNAILTKINDRNNNFWDSNQQQGVQFVQQPHAQTNYQTQPTVWHQLSNPQNVYNNQNNNNYDNNYSNNNNFYNGNRNYYPVTYNPQPVVQSDDEICGRIDDRAQVTPLIFGGDTIPRGLWPWLAAVYLSRSRNLSFICGGNLVSSRAVVSAAHCFKSRELSVRASEVVIILGRYNMDRWGEDGSKSVDVQSIAIHADYMKVDGSYDADIAVVLLRERVQYTEFIRPICLWTGPEDSSQLTGQMGTVVGWGRDEAGNRITPMPKKIELPIVSEATCLRSHDTFRHFTSVRTFCAGKRDGLGPCNGDSGGGMTLKRGNRWMLRGIVSSALSNPDTYICNLNEYVVFTDTAKFTSWIRSYMYS